MYPEEDEGQGHVDRIFRVNHSSRVYIIVAENMT